MIINVAGIANHSHILIYFSVALPFDGLDATCTYTKDVLLVWGLPCGLFFI